MNKPVDWLSFGLAQATTNYANRITTIARSLELDKKITFEEALNLGGWIDYNFNKDEFYFTVEVIPEQPLSAKVCKQVLIALNQQRFFRAFPGHFVPRSFEYNDMPTGLANKILEKSFFVCGKQKYEITERF